MKCEGCPNAAEWVVYESPTDRYAPLCDRHFHELEALEGEIALEFWNIELEDFEGVLKDVNERLKSQSDRYSALLSRFTKRPGVEKFRELAVRLHQIASEVADS